MIIPTKLLLPVVFGFSALAALVAPTIFHDDRPAASQEISSLAMIDPQRLHQLTDEGFNAFPGNCEAACMEGSLIPVTGITPTVNPRSELEPTAETLLPGGCLAKPDPTFVEQTLALVNQERVKRGYPILKLDPRLTEAARKHSQEMACRNYFSHQSLDGSNPFERMAAEYYPMEYAAENLYAGNQIYNTPAMAFDGWMNSPGHRAAMLNPIFDEVGVGYYYNPRTYLGGFITMDFGKQVEPTPELGTELELK
jgi:uncharacterized protein YkwD